MTSSKRPADGISYDRRGSGSPIVLLHGIGSRWEVFEPILDRLALAHDVIAVDFPGFGESPKDPAVTTTIDGFADWLTGWMAELGIERPHVVGNSMGGAIAIELGRRGVASRVTVFSPAGYWTPAQRRWAQGVITTMRNVGKKLPKAATFGSHSAVGRTALFSAFFGKPWLLKPAAAQHAVDGLVGATAYDETCAGFDEFNLRSEPRPVGALAEIPFTIAWGSHDVILPRTQSAVAQQRYPFAEHVSLPGLGHLPFSDDPALCAEVVLATQGR